MKGGGKPWVRQHPAAGGLDFARSAHGGSWPPTAPRSSLGGGCGGVVRASQIYGSRESLAVRPPVAPVRPEQPAETEEEPHVSMFQQQEQYDAQSPQAFGSPRDRGVSFSSQWPTLSPQPASVTMHCPPHASGSFGASHGSYGSQWEPRGRRHHPRPFAPEPGAGQGALVNPPGHTPRMVPPKFPSNVPTIAPAKAQATFGVGSGYDWGSSFSGAGATGPGKFSTLPTPPPAPLQGSYASQAVPPGMPKSGGVPAILAERTVRMRNMPGAWLTPEGRPEVAGKVKELLEAFGKLEGQVVVSENAALGVFALARFVDVRAGTAAVQTLNGLDNRVEFKQGQRTFQEAYKLFLEAGVTELEMAEATKAAAKAALEAAPPSSEPPALTDGPSEAATATAATASAAAESTTAASAPAEGSSAPDAAPEAAAAAAATSDVKAASSSAGDGPPEKSPVHFSWCVDELQQATGDPMPDDREVFVRDLPAQDCSEDELREWLSGFGELEDAVFLRDPVSGSLTGAGYARFRSHAEAATLLAALKGDSEAGAVQGSWSLSERLRHRDHPSLQGDVLGSLRARLPKLRTETGVPSLSCIGRGSRGWAAAGMPGDPNGPLRLAWIEEPGQPSAEAIKRQLRDVLLAEIAKTAAQAKVQERLAKVTGEKGAAATAATEATSEPAAAAAGKEKGSDDGAATRDADSSSNREGIAVRGFPVSWTAQEVRLLFAVFGGVDAVQMKEGDGGCSAHVRLREGAKAAAVVKKLNGSQVGDGELIERCVIACEVLEAGPPEPSAAGATPATRDEDLSKAGKGEKGEKFNKKLKKDKKRKRSPSADKEARRLQMAGAHGMAGLFGRPGMPPMAPWAHGGMAAPGMAPPGMASAAMFGPCGGVAMWPGAHMGAGAQQGFRPPGFPMMWAPGNAMAAAAHSMAKRGDRRRRRERSRSRGARQPRRSDKAKKEGRGRARTRAAEPASERGESSQSSGCCENEETKALGGSESEDDFALRALKAAATAPGPGGRGAGAAEAATSAGSAGGGGDGGNKRSSATQGLGAGASAAPAGRQAGGPAEEVPMRPSVSPSDSSSSVEPPPVVSQPPPSREAPPPERAQGLAPTASEDSSSEASPRRSPSPPPDDQPLPRATSSKAAPAMPPGKERRPDRGVGVAAPKRKRRRRHSTIAGEAEAVVPGSERAKEGAASVPAGSSPSRLGRVESPPRPALGIVPEAKPKRAPTAPPAAPAEPPEGAAGRSDEAAGAGDDGGDGKHRRRVRRRVSSRGATAKAAPDGPVAADVASAAESGTRPADVQMEIDRGLALINEGRKLARNRDRLEEAYESYVRGLKRLLQLDKVDPQNASLQNQIRRYVEEAEKLHDQLKGSKQGSKPTEGPPPRAPSPRGGRRRSPSGARTGERPVPRGSGGGGARGRSSPPAPARGEPTPRGRGRNVFDTERRSRRQSDGGRSPRRAGGGGGAAGPGAPGSSDGSPEAGRRRVFLKPRLEEKLASSRRRK